MRSILLIAAAVLLSGCAAIAEAPVAKAGETHYWLHPKLGMVKVDAKTHAIVAPGR